MDDGWVIAVTTKSFSAGRIIEDVYVAAIDDPKKALAAVRRYAGSSGSDTEINAPVGQSLLELRKMKKGEVRKLGADRATPPRGRVRGRA